MLLSEFHAISSWFPVLSGNHDDLASLLIILDITVADRFLSLAENLCQPSWVNCIAREIDVTNMKQLEEVITAHNMVISLLPNTFNVMIAEACLHAKKHLVTASCIHVIKKCSRNVLLRVFSSKNGMRSAHSIFA